MIEWLLCEFARGEAELIVQRGYFVSTLRALAEARERGGNREVIGDWWLVSLLNA